MQQYTSGTRDAYNAAGNIFINHTGAAAGSGDDLAEGLGTDFAADRDDDGSAWIGWAILGAFALVIAVCVGSCSGSSGDGGFKFPSNEKWPAGVTTGAVVAPVAAWLATTCAHETGLAPTNCPQSASANGDSVSHVQWTLHGNPIDGARVSYSDGKFWVLGHAVMTVTYDDSSSGASWQMDNFGYETIVSWNSGHAAIIAPVQPVSMTAGPAVVKHDPRVLWSQVSAAVLAGFRRCAASTTAPLPADCPGIGDDGDKVTWTLWGNPLLNALETFDPATGIIHVTGSYSMSESYHLRFWGNRETDEFPDNYDAYLSLDGTKVTLLQIVDKG